MAQVFTTMARPSTSSMSLKNSDSSGSIASPGPDPTVPSCRSHMFPYRETLAPNHLHEVSRARVCHSCGKTRATKLNRPTDPSSVYASPKATGRRITNRHSSSRLLSRARAHASSGKASMEAFYSDNDSVFKQMCAPMHPALGPSVVMPGDYKATTKYVKKLLCRRPL
jgi:hypothetical protein